jgi:D-cysteine desulfhydrase family pyridoxal phosphate-dependent enzyme
VLLDNIPRLSLGNLPTPLDEAPRLGRDIGLRRLLIKRDDLTGLGLGGNKVRKLEFLLADAVKERADVILTDGGPQSNHARLTAAAARLIGRDSVLFLGGPRFERFDGNLLLDIIFGAEIRYMPDATVGQMEDAMNMAAIEMRIEGKRPYVIPIGGSSPVGALGYVSAIRELAEQLGEDKNPQIFLAVGSGGTLAGVTLGVRLFLPEARVIGISVGKVGKSFQQVAKDVAEGAAELIGEKQTFDTGDIEVSEDYLGKRYGVPSEAGIQAIFRSARTEGIVLDPVYTGKAMSGLIGYAEKGLIDPERTTIFLHTGGSPALFAFEEEFRKYANYREV